MDKTGLFNINIAAPGQKAYNASQMHWDSIAKPLDGLGRLEDMVKKIAAIMGTADVRIDKKAVVVMCADNGVTSEGVSQSGHDVTTAVALNMANGTASICRMAHIAGADVIPVDIGMKDDIYAEGILKRKVAHGTADFAIKPAMTEEGLLKAINMGIGIACCLKEKGYKITATGEMGIGNTTTSCALASLFLGLPVKEVAGRGAGLSNEGLERKISVISNAIEKYNLRSKIHMNGIKEGTFEALRCVGGLDIAGLAGFFTGCAIYHIPVVIDGLISAVAALAAERMIPGCRDYMLASHIGKEPACKHLLDKLGLEPVIDAKLALGEGTGAVLLFPMLEMALSVYRGNTTFDDIKVKQYKRYI